MSVEDPSNARRLGREGSVALKQLRRGELTVEQYAEARLEKAIAALPLRLTAEQREAVRETLRAQLPVDPVVAEYLRLVSGAGERGHG